MKKGKKMKTSLKKKKRKKKKTLLKIFANPAYDKYFFPLGAIMIMILSSKTVIIYSDEKMVTPKSNEK